ncbi:hypothetical protein ANCCAN_15426 [Ancylostoma caninum]|uniref:DUF7622 domain-containing protein n=1 Tax=Ancylostoma caninum TaxID=29170 RepID=A0A368G4M8_ANCCA|nr:hypothetical protein ANCCAN_15426 [Ancylostoma caninum]
MSTKRRIRINEDAQECAHVLRFSIWINLFQVDTNHFCDGDYCFVQKHNGKYTKGCLSVNERNSWSHLKSGHRHILGVDQWLCQHHLCNFDLNRVARAIAPSHKSIYRLNTTSDRFSLTVIVLMFSVYVRELCLASEF